jgi:hypothetical protein
MTSSGYVTEDATILAVADATMTRAPANTSSMGGSPST